MKKIFSFDIDDTIVSPIHKDIIPKEVLEALNKLSENHIVLLNTGRDKPNALRVHKQLIVNDNTKYLSLYSGGQILNTITNEIVYESKMDGTIIKEMIDELDKDNLIIFSLSSLEAYALKTNEWKVGIEGLVIKNLNEMRSNDLEQKVLIGYKTFEEMMIVYKKLKEKYGEILHFAHSKENDEFPVKSIEITSIYSKKSIAIREIKKLSEDIDEVISFGDSMNDYDKAEASDQFFVVENAPDELKSIATGIIPTAVNNGVLKIVNNYIESK